MTDRKKEIIDAFYFRHACKEFDADKKISKADFDFLLETARLSPSSFGFEPWKILVVQKDSLKDRIKTVAWGAQRQLPGASHFIIILSRKFDAMQPDSEYISNLLRGVHKYPEDIVELRRGRYKNFIENDFHLLESERAFFDWSARQTYILLGNMMTAAAMIGIDSCPVEGFDYDQLEEILDDEGLLEGKRFGIACMAAFGYRKSEPRPKTRQAIEDIVRYV